MKALATAERARIRGQRAREAEQRSSGGFEGEGETEMIGGWGRPVTYTKHWRSASDQMSPFFPFCFFSLFLSIQ